MTNCEKKLDALIDALGFDVEAVSVGNYELTKAFGGRPAIVKEAFDYKLTKRKDPLDVLYDGVSLEQLIRNIIDISQLEEKYRWIKYPKTSFDAVVDWFGDSAEKLISSYEILGVEVMIDD